MSEGISSNKKLNLVMNNIIFSIQEGQTELFNLAEEIRGECDDIRVKLHEVNSKKSSLEKEIKTLKILDQSKKQTLFLVSQNFSNYGEEDIRRAYDEANAVQTRLAVIKEEANILILNISDLERRLESKNKLVAKTVILLDRINAVISFLEVELSEVEEKIDILETKTKAGIQIIKAQEEERKRIARDIHDGPAQHIAALIIKSEILEKLYKKKSNEFEEELSTLRTQLKQVLKDIRAIMYDLRPFMLDDLGLAAATRNFVNNLINAKDIEIEVHEAQSNEIKSPLVKLVAFRGIQESIQNAIKHGNPNNIEVNINVSPKIVKVEIIDDGRGYNTQEITPAFGLTAMRERVQMIMGKLESFSEKGEGTRVTFEIPNEEESYGK